MGAERRKREKMENGRNTIEGIAQLISETKKEREEKGKKRKEKRKKIESGPKILKKEQSS